MQSGAIAIAAYCLSCGRVATKDAYIPKRRFSLAQIDEMAIEHDYSNSALVCCVEGCTNHDVEWHHFAPKGIFGEDAEKWPKAWVCKAHHDDWHKRTKTGAWTVR